ncbi:hypothetical protein F4W70_03915 [Pseudomonas cannabina]|nr:hypothetical protein F4W70_03915 [Pseudomonas cannabina]
MHNASRVRNTGLLPGGRGNNRATLSLCGSGLVREGYGGSNKFFADVPSSSRTSPLLQKPRNHGQAKRRPVLSCIAANPLRSRFTIHKQSSSRTRVSRPPVC